MDKNLNKIIEHLYDTPGNDDQVALIELNLGISAKEIYLIIKSLSINKGMVIGIDKGLNYNYRLIQLTDIGIDYVRNLRQPKHIKILNHINGLSGFYTVIIALLALVVSIFSITISLQNNELQTYQNLEENLGSSN